MCLRILCLLTLRASRWTRLMRIKLGPCSRRTTRLASRRTRTARRATSRRGISSESSYLDKSLSSNSSHSNHSNHSNPNQLLNVETRDVVLHLHLLQLSNSNSNSNSNSIRESRHIEWWLQIVSLSNTKMICGNTCIFFVNSMIGSSCSRSSSCSNNNCSSRFTRRCSSTCSSSSTSSIHSR
jgi:hypothetical protein